MTIDFTIWNYLINSFPGNCLTSRLSSSCNKIDITGAVVSQHFVNSSM